MKRYIFRHIEDVQGTTVYIYSTAVFGLIRCKISYNSTNFDLIRTLCFVAKEIAGVNC